MTTTSTTDRIEKTITLRAPRTRVWRALTNAEEFGTWFRVRIDGLFNVGSMVKGQITHPGFEHAMVDMLVERMEPEHLFSYRWHPDAIDMSVDYSAEPMTLVEFHLADAADGTELTIVESGFDALPADRRDVSFRGNEKGWSGQLKNIATHVGG